MYLSWDVPVLRNTSVNAIIHTSETPLDCNDFTLVSAEVPAKLANSHSLSLQVKPWNATFCRRAGEAAVRGGALLCGSTASPSSAHTEQGWAGNHPHPFQVRHGHYRGMYQHSILKALQIFEVVTTRSLRIRSILLTTLMSSFKRLYCAYAYYSKCKLKSWFCKNSLNFCCSRKWNTANHVNPCKIIIKILN